MNDLQNYIDAWEDWDENPGNYGTARTREAFTQQFAGIIGVRPTTLHELIAYFRREGKTPAEAITTAYMKLVRVRS